MVKTIVVILIVLVLLTACGPANSVDELEVKEMESLVYLGRANYVDLYRFRDNGTTCWLAVKYESTSIYCK